MEPKYGLESWLEVWKQNITGHCKQSFESKRFVEITQQCFALLTQVNFSTHNLNLYWRLMRSNPGCLLKSFLLYGFFNSIYFIFFIKYSIFCFAFEMVLAIVLIFFPIKPYLNYCSCLRSFVGDEIGPGLWDPKSCIFLKNPPLCRLVNLQ